VASPLLSSLGMAAVVYGVRSTLPYQLFSVWILAATGIASYLLFSYLLIGSSIIGDVKKTFSIFRNQ
jgi:hypothetical protein